ncbi:unnamed protein product [Caenorhabditis sp. 36 PRJEB53466]|nr:unnamed protein product [Caenorhabditis sp. 36 PRJEB53466]
MSSLSSLLRWRIVKYRQLRKNGKCEEDELSLIVDADRRELCVYWRGREQEKIEFTKDPSKYPKLRFRELNLYVMYNDKFEGFRLSFTEKDKEEFLWSMLSLGCSLESNPNQASQASPLPPSTPFPPVHQSSADYRPSNSSTQPILSSHETAAIFNPYASPNLPHAFSQPIFDAYMRPEIPFHGDSFPRPSYQTFSTPSPLPTFSQIPPPSSASPHFFSPIPPPAPPARLDKSMQTDDLLDELCENPEFAKECLRNLMENGQFANIIKTQRVELRKISRMEKDQIYKNTDPSPRNEIQLSQVSLPSQSQPPAVKHQQTSDLEHDVFSQS